jgi:hypothetical protein
VHIDGRKRLQLQILKCFEFYRRFQGYDSAVEEVSDRDAVLSAERNTLSLIVVTDDPCSRKVSLELHHFPALRESR